MLKPYRLRKIKVYGKITTKGGGKNGEKELQVMDNIGHILGGNKRRGTRAPAISGKTYKRKPGGGRKPLPKRQVLEGIFYVLRTGCHWKAVPKEYGAGSSIHRYFQEWEAAGFFERIWSKGLEQYDELEGVGWEWQSLDGCMVKAPLALESVGKNPTDRGKMGTKRSVLTDKNGLPLAVVLSGANTHDVKLLEDTLDHIVMLRPEPDQEHPQNLCLDAGYTGSAEKVESRGYIPHIRPRGEEKGFVK